MSLFPPGWNAADDRKTTKTVEIYQSYYTYRGIIQFSERNSAYYNMNYHKKTLLYFFSSET